jgi:RNA polymerase sigma-70 factor, ECF subfamily
MSDVLAIGVRSGSEELDLVARAREGDQRAFNELIAPRLERALRLANSILGHEADARDVVQETCITVWRELPRLRDTQRFDAWLTRILVNGCRSALRGRRRHAVRELSPGSVSLEATAASLDRPPAEHVSSADAIRRAFGRLDADRRALLVLHHVDGRSVASIAAVLGIPEGTVKWRLHAARTALERALEGEER